MAFLDGATLAPPTGAAFDELRGWMADLKTKVAASIERQDPAAPETLQFAVVAMLTTHFKPKDLSILLGPSQTTIARWALGQTIPRSPPYRAWLVGALLGHLRGHIECQSLET